MRIQIKKKDLFVDMRQFEAICFRSFERLRDLSLQDKTEISGLKKSNEEFSAKLKTTTKENETLKEEVTLYKSQINELKDQVRISQIQISSIPFRSLSLILLGSISHRYKLH